MNRSLLGTDEQSRATLEQTLATWWSAALGIPTIGRDEDFFRLGCDSERGSLVLGQIRQELNIGMAVFDLFEARTISKLADLIEIRHSSMDALSVIPIRAGGNRQPLFLVHGVGGNILGFGSLVRALDPDQPVYGIQAQALQGNKTVLTQLESMAAYYVRELRLVQPAGPYALLGFSFGGLVAYEMAQQLSAAGESVNLLGMLDTWQPGYLHQVESATAWPVRAWHRMRLVSLHTRKLSKLQTVRYTLGRLKSRVLRVMYVRMANSDGVSLPGSMRRVRDINLMAAARYVVRPYSGTITLFRARMEDTPQLPEDLGWREYAQGGVALYHLRGDHGEVLAGPNVAELARTLSACLAEKRTVSKDGHRSEFELMDDEFVPAGGSAVEVEASHLHQQYSSAHSTCRSTAPAARAAGNEGCKESAGSLVKGTIQPRSVPHDQHS